MLSLQDIDTPAIKDDEVLVRVRAASVHPDVWHVVTGRPYVLRVMGSGLRRPKNRVAGTDLAGVVESTGARVTQFKRGDEVFGECIKGYQWVNGGAYAEYAAVRHDWIALKPSNVTFEQAASVPTSGIIALSGLRNQGKLEAGQNVLINGAGGGVGLLAVQIAKAYDAEVTGVDDKARQDVLRSAGADRVIDYIQQDFTQSGERYDLILDIPGNHPFSKIKRALTPDGIYVLIAHDNYGQSGRKWLGSIPKVFRLMARTPFSRHMPKTGFSMPNKTESIATLREFMEAGKITPVIGKTIPISQSTTKTEVLLGGGLGCRWEWWN